MIENVRKGLSKTLQVCIALIIFTLVALNGIQVILRYATKSGIVWANDFQVYCLYVIVSLSIPYLWLERKHVVMDYADKIFSPKVLEWLARICDVWACGIGSLMFYSAYRAFLSNRGMITNSLGYDESLVYLPFMIGAVPWVFSAVIDLIKRFKEGK